MRFVLDITWYLLPGLWTAESESKFESVGINVLAESKSELKSVKFAPVRCPSDPTPDR